jgi:hypothetical protein
MDLPIMPDVRPQPESQPSDLSSEGSSLTSAVQLTRVIPAVLPSVPTIQLSPEQQQVLNRIKAGQSVFFTGSAGTGKSVLLREIIKWCKANGQVIAVTASTGIASVNIGGSTIHSWAGIGLGKEDAEKLVGKILGQDKYRRMKEKEARRKQGLPSDDEDNPYSENRQSRVVQRWRSCQTLIIDEGKSVRFNFIPPMLTAARQSRWSMVSCSTS